MVDARQQRAEHLAIVDDAADRSAAEADAVIAALAADQAGAGALALDLMIGQRDLERGIGGLRSGIAEEHVIEAGGREIGDAACEFEGLRNAELERRRIIQRLGLLGDRRRNLGAAVAGIGAPHAGCGVDDLAAVDGEVMHVLGAGEQPRRLLEGPVGGERHPVRGKVVGHVDGGGAWALVQHGGLFEFRSVALSRKLSASSRDGNATAGSYFALIGRFTKVCGSGRVHKSAAAIQNTSPSESSVSSHSSGNCGNAASSAVAAAADLAQQPALRRQVPSGLVQDAADDVEAVGAAVEGELGFGAAFARQPGHALRHRHRAGWR